MKTNKILGGVKGTILATMIIPACMLASHGVGHLSEDTRSNYTLQNRFVAAYNPNATFHQKYYSVTPCADKVTGRPRGRKFFAAYPMNPITTYPAHLLLAALGAWMGATTKTQKLRALSELRQATK